MEIQLFLCIDFPPRIISSDAIPSDLSVMEVLLNYDGGSDSGMAGFI